MSDSLQNSGLTHINEKGEAHMVDVSDRGVSVRTATASGKVLIKPEVLTLISDGKTPKGDVLATARIAGIQGAKRTSELIPLCHPLAISKISVDLEVMSDGVKITSFVKIEDKTGVEMEALTAVCVAALTIIDMIKALDPHSSIVDVRVEEKDGGRNGSWKRQ